jgi:hypothetical protein
MGWTLGTLVPPLQSVFAEHKAALTKLLFFGEEGRYPDGRLWCDWEFEGWGGPSPEARAAAHRVAYPPLEIRWNEDR